MALTTAAGGDVSFLVIGDGSATTITITLSDLATLLGYAVPSSITAVNLVNLSLPAGSAGVACRPTVASAGAAILLTFSAALTNAANYSIALRLWA